MTGNNKNLTKEKYTFFEHEVYSTTDTLLPQQFTIDFDSLKTKYPHTRKRLNALSSDNKERAAETHPSGQFEDREKGHRREVKDH